MKKRFIHAFSLYTIGIKCQINVSIVFVYALYRCHTPVANIVSVRV